MRRDHRRQQVGSDEGPGPDFSKTFDEELRRQLKFLDYAPLLHISASTGERTGKVLETIDKVAEARDAPDPDGGAESLRRRRSPPFIPRPARAAARCASSTPRRPSVAPPTFVFFTNVATEFHFSYERFLVNRLRESFGLLGTPVRIQVRRRG